MGKKTRFYLLACCNLQTYKVTAFLLLNIIVHAVFGWTGLNVGELKASLAEYEILSRL